MIGLLSLGFLAGYIFLIVLAARFGAHLARRSGHNPKLWGFIAGLLVYLPVFWDFIPTLALQCYYCATEGGFTVNKTLEQWKAENPGVAETLKPIRNTPWIEMGDRTRVPLNQRFAWDRFERRHLFGVREREERIVDIKTGETLARYVDFDTGIPNKVGAQESFRDYKFWLAVGSCPREAFDPNWVVDGDSFVTLEDKFKHIKGEVK